MLFPPNNNNKIINNNNGDEEIQSNKKFAESFQLLWMNVALFQALVSSRNSKQLAKLEFCIEY